MNLKKIFLLVLCTLLVFTALFPTVGAFATSSDYDYSRAGSYFNTTFNTADVLELVGYELSEGERIYLESYGDLNVKYETVTTQQIGVITVDGVSRVNAHTYSYVGVNGTEVTWTPISASIDGVEAPLVLSDGVYVADFEGVETTDSSVVNVKYEMSAVRIKAMDVNSVLNVAFTDATSLKAEITSYRDNLDEINEYFTLLALYKKYLGEKLIFDQKKSAYDKYLSDCQQYLEDLARYEAYLAELEEYNRIKDNNDNYDANLAKYNAEKLKYDQYLDNLALAETQIKMLDDALMTKVTYLDRQLYACLFSGLVDEVVSMKDVVSVAGVNKADIDACAVASANIRAILKPVGGKAYTELKTTEEKYTFYINNYEGLRDNIILLTKGLHIIYSNNAVRLGMHAAPSVYGRPDYTEKLSILIAQLICLSNALSTEPVMSMDGKRVLDYNTTFDYRTAAGVDKKDVKVSDVLESVIFVTDIANPVPVSIVEVPQPTPPVLLELPDAPREVVRPTVPTEVADPGRAPEVVSEPVRPAFAPETQDRLAILDNEIYQLLIEDLDLGLLDGERPELTEDVYFTPTVTVTKNLAVTDMVEVTFLDTDGAVITSIGAEKGTAVNFTDTLPRKAEDISATYVFDSWVSSEDEAYNLSSVSEDVTLYPSFKPVYKEYGVVEKGSRYLDVSILGESLSTVPMAHFIELAHASHLGILLTADNVILTIPYATVTELAEAGVDRFDVFVDTSSISSYSCSIFGYDNSDRLTVHVGGISVSLPCSDEAFAKNSVLSYVTVDEVIEVSKSYSSGYVTFVATTRTDYSFELKYSISANSNLSGKITAPNDAIPGDTVTLEINIPKGTKVETLYYILLSDNSRHTIEGDSFVMPYGNIRLGATFTELEYTVKFVSDGKVISEKGGYKYGDTVKLPNNPIKLNDDKYSYKFIGWSPVITEVTEDVTYVAEFEATPLPVVEKTVSLFKVFFYSGLTVFILAVLVVTTLILNKIGVINVGGVLNLVKRKFTRAGDKAQDESNEKDAEE